MRSTSVIRVVGHCSQYVSFVSETDTVPIPASALALSIRGFVVFGFVVLIAQVLKMALPQELARSDSTL